MTHAVAPPDSRPKMAIVMGDATGIGPEVVAKSFANEETYQLCRPVVIGDARVMNLARQLTRAPFTIYTVKNWSEVSGQPGRMEMFDLGNLDPKDYRVGEVSPRTGRSCLEYLEFAVKEILSGKAAGLVFAPLNKGAMHLAGSGWFAVGVAWIASAFRPTRMPRRIKPVGARTPPGGSPPFPSRRAASRRTRLCRSLPDEQQGSPSSFQTRSVTI